MTRFRSALGFLGFLALLVGMILAGSAGLGLAAILGILALSASTTTSGTLQNLWAGLQLRSDGHIRPGVLLVVPALSGPDKVCRVGHIGARLTILHTPDGGLYLQPNSALTSSGQELPPTQPKEETHAHD